MDSNDTLELELKQLIVEVLKLEEIKPQDIESTQALFNEGLGLDSIDALEIGVAVQKRYGLRFDANSPEETRKHFANVRALATFLRSSNASKVDHAN